MSSRLALHSLHVLCKRSEFMKWTFNGEFRLHDASLKTRDRFLCYSLLIVYVNIFLHFCFGKNWPAIVHEARKASRSNCQHCYCIFGRSRLQISARKPAILSPCFRCFPLSLQEHAGEVHQIKLRPLQSSSSGIHYPPVILSLDTV
jgi:hypothetical protein